MRSQFSFPLVGPHSCPGPLQSHLTRREVWRRGNCSTKKQWSNPTVVKIYSFCKSYENIGPWEHNAGALPRALEGPEHVRAWSLNFLCSGERASACGGRHRVQLRASATWLGLRQSLSWERHNFWSFRVFPSTPAPVNTSAVPLFWSLDGGRGGRLEATRPADVLACERKARVERCLV